MNSSIKNEFQKTRLPGSESHGVRGAHSGLLCRSGQPCLPADDFCVLWMAGSAAALALLFFSAFLPKGPSSFPAFASNAPKEVVAGWMDKKLSWIVVDPTPSQPRRAPGRTSPEIRWSCSVSFLARWTWQGVP